MNGVWNGSEGDVPDVAATRDHLQDELVRFARALRLAGADVPANAATTGARALVELGIEDRERVRVGLRACLITREPDLSTFERLFPEFWRRLVAGPDDAGAPAPADGPDGGLAGLGEEADPDELPDPTDDDSDSEDPDEDDSMDRTLESFGAVVTDDAGETESEGAETALYSRSGRATAVEGRTGVPGEDGLARAFDALTAELATLRGRRYRPGDDRADLRRALRTSVATGGTVVDPPRRQRRLSAVRAVLLVDVSRSVLDTIDRGFLLSFLGRCRRDWRDARVFFFDEDLREVSEAFDQPTGAAALAALERAEAEWGGGTRIGGSFERLRETAPEAIDHRTVVFVVSDGLEMGDVDVLERELSGISRRALAVLWLNPLAGSAQYEPAARGMAASLPFVDGLFAFTASEDVADIASQIRRQGLGGTIGYEFDRRRVIDP